MKLLILCTVLSVVLAVSLASPVKIQIHDETDTSDSSESAEVGKSSSSSEEEKPKVAKQQRIKIKDSDEGDDNSTDSSEEQLEDNVANEIISLEDEENRQPIAVVHDNDVFKIKKVAGKSKRSVDSAAHANNKLTVVDGDKHFKTDRLRHDLEKLSRFERSADTSEENSSEEGKNANDNKGASKQSENNAAAPAKDAVVASNSEKAPAEAAPVESSQGEAAPAESAAAEKAPAEVAVKSDVAPAESEPKAEGSRRRRNADDSSEENNSVQEQDLNEVFIFSNENQHNSEEDFKSDRLKLNEYVVLNEKAVESSEKSLETKTSDEDYAQGCGEDNQDEDSNENSNEDKETIIENKL